MKTTLSILFIIGTVVSLSVLFYYVRFDFEADKIFLSISTFLFSIFTSFFISRQASRFNRVRERVTEFGGKMSSIYRSSGHISKELQNSIGKVVLKHYKKVLSSGEWDIHFKDKSTTLKDIHGLLDTYVVDAEVTKLSNQALGSIVKNLAACQDIRKQVVTLSKERIPKEQWILILFFAAMLVSTVSTIESGSLVFASILKSAFVVSVISVLYILYKLNNLVYSESIMGQKSCEDVLEIIKGTK